MALGVEFYSVKSSISGTVHVRHPALLRAHNRSTTDGTKVGVRGRKQCIARVFKGIEPSQIIEFVRNASLDLFLLGYNLQNSPAKRINQICGSVESSNHTASAFHCRSNRD